MPKQPTGALLVEKAKDGSGFYWAAKWIPGPQQPPKKKRIGRAWIEARPEPLEGAEGWQKGYRKRRGQPQAGFLLPDEAAVAMRALIRNFSQQHERERERQQSVTFRDAAWQWFAERKAVAGWKPTHERNVRAILRDQDDVPRKRGQKPRALLMRAFGDRNVADVTEADVRAFLRELDADPKLGPRAVNTYRLTAKMIFDYAVEQNWRADNPAAKTKKRREPDRAEMVVYTPEQIFAIARECPSEQLGALVVLAACLGCRQGELLELRWRDIDFVRRNVHVQRSFSSGLGVTSTKGRESRVVPMSRIPAQILARISQRGFLVKKNDLVFPGPRSGLIGGTHMDPSWVRKHYYRAVDAAKAKDREMPTLRFRMLRQCFGSLLAAGGVDQVKLQAVMGHKDARTTAGYMHAVSRADDADQLTRAFDSHGAEGLIFPEWPTPEPARKPRRRPAIRSASEAA